MKDALKKWLVALAIAVVVVAGVLYAQSRGSVDKFSPGRDSLAVLIEKEQSSYLKTEKPFSSLLNALEDNKVRTLAITADGELLVRVVPNERFYVHAPVPSALLTDTLTNARAKDVTVVTLRTQANPPSVSMVSTVLSYAKDALPLALLLVLLVMARGSLGMLGGNKSFTVVKDPGIRFDDVIGADDAKQALDDVVEYLRNPKRFVDIGARAPKGVLMEGPPGTGKTLLAKAVAGECGVSFISLNGASFSAPFVGVGVMRVKQLFKEAAKLAPCVIFIDELDGVGNRESNGQGGAADTENSRIINAILTELDGFDSASGVVVIGATNYSGRLDAALTREGRFDRRCSLGLPNISERVALFQLYAKKLAVASDVDWSRLARRSAGMAPSALAAVINAAAISVAKAGRVEVLDHDLWMALERQQLGAPTMALHKAMTDSLRERVAVHEAGHALVGWKTGMGTLDGVTIVPRSRALGVTLLTQETEDVLHTASELRARIATFLAGRGAELLVLGEASTGASNDLERASHIALSMVSETGLAGRHGPFSFKALGREAEALTRDQTLPDAVALMAEVEAETMAVLSAHRPALDALTQALLERETLSGEEALQVMEAALTPAA